MGRLKRLLGFESDRVHALSLSDGDRIETTTDDIDGALLNVVRHRENPGIEGAAGMFTSLYDDTFRTPNAFEIWFHDGKIQFFVWAANDLAADDFQRFISTNYTNCRVHEIERGRSIGFPTVEGNAAAVDIRFENPIAYLPIKNHKDHEGGFEFDPFQEVLAAMLADDATSVVVQCVAKPVPRTWTDRTDRNDRSVDDIAEWYRQPSVVGWVNIRYRKPSDKDEQIARAVENQRHKPAYDVNLRVLAISPDAHTAATRAANVGRMFSNYYNLKTEQGLRYVPVDARTEWGHRRALLPFIERMRHRRFRSHGMIMTVPEIAGVGHIPGGDVDVQQIDEVFSKTGGEIPADAPKHTPIDPTEVAAEGSVADGDSGVE